MHRERIGTEDEVGSLAVYRGNVHCFGCGFHLYRRYASLAFLLGLWDGRGDENSEKCRAIVRDLKQRLPEFINEETGEIAAQYEAPPPDPMMAESFHQFLLTVMEDRLVDELMVGRGFSLETIKEYKLGHTGTHFTIPLYSLDGSLQALRYRADERYTDPGASDYRKYEGTWGRNAPLPYPMQRLHGVSALEEVWIVEGEFDAISVNQAGDVALTITNGATNLDKLPGLLFAALPTLFIGRWVIASDQDKAGDQAARKLRSALSDQSVVRARWPWGKDLTEFYASGGSRKKIEYKEFA